MNYMDYETEIREALVAADDALDDLYAARDHLRSARNWGIFDIFGGGIIATMIKRRNHQRNNPKTIQNHPYSD